MNLAALWAQARKTRPLIHAITNNVTVNDCANMILAAYGAPTMAQDEREAAEITALSDALVLNLGALRAQEAMLLAGRQANALGKAIVFDPVAAGASRLRGETSRKLLDALRLTVIRGNASEIRALALGSETTKGVEVSAVDKVTEKNLVAALDMARGFSRRTGAVIALTGALDLITDGTRAVVIRNGCERMSRITGAGCMLTSLIAVLVAANPSQPFEATVAATAAMGISGELAEQKVCQRQEGTASFRTHLIDAVSNLTAAHFAAARVEEMTDQTAAGEPPGAYKSWK